MTQDPYGQPQGSGYVVRGEVVPDDEASATPPTVPVTRFQKVASALRGERTDPAVPSGPDPNGTWPGAGESAATTIPNAPALEDDAPSEDARSEDARSEDASSEDVGAVRSAETGNGGYWGDEDETHPEDAATAVAPAGTAAAGAAGMAGAAEPGTVGRHAGAPVQGSLRPGEADGGLGDFSNLLPDAAEFKTRWHQVQFRFVDDPAGSVTEAADVIAQVTTMLEAAIQERQRAISERQRALRDRWSEGKGADTESLRETLLMYRAFLDQLTGPKIS